MDFENSVVGKLVKDLGKLNVAQRASLSSAAKKNQPVKVNQLLNQSNVFIWKGLIENVVVPASAISDAEKFLVLNKKMQATVAGSSPLPGVLKAVKNLAHEPSVLHELICALWSANHYKHNEAVRAANYLTSK